MSSLRSLLSPLLALSPVFAGLLLPACAASSETSPTSEAPLTAPAAGAERAIDTPGPITLETVVSARWAVLAGGLVNLADPKAQAAEIDGLQLVPIVLSVHVLTHPTRGLFVVDTGVPRSWKKGAPTGVVGPILPQLVADIDPVEPLADIVARQGKPLAGVFFTHLHFDHILGMPEVPAGTPVWVGPHERNLDVLDEALVGPTLDRMLAGHPVRTFDFNHGRPLGAVREALDVFGDGSLYALRVPGHTEGSTAYLVRTTNGPVLLTGDCSHTLWGWNHDVVPGFFTHDQKENADSLAQLRGLSEAHPAMRVLVGHETDGAGTGIP